MAHSSGLSPPKNGCGCCEQFHPPGAPPLSRFWRQGGRLPQLPASQPRPKFSAWSPAQKRTKSATERQHANSLQGRSASAPGRARPFQSVSCNLAQNLPATPIADRFSARPTDPGMSVESKQSVSDLIRTANTRPPNLSVFARAARAFVWIGRVLLVLTAILLLTTPLTQYLWTWDNFPHGGQDYESTMLLVMAFLCLALVLAQHCRKCVEDQFLAPQCQSSSLSPRPLSAGSALAGASSKSHSERGSSPGLEMYSLPLQI